MDHSLVILCGGKSRRMGMDKAAMLWQGVPILAHIISGFPKCDDILLSVRDKYQTLPSIPGKNIAAVRDEISRCGPIGGVTAALRECHHKLLFVTTCDAPFASESTAGTMLSHLTQEVDAVVVRSHDGRVHPLIALHRKSTLSKAIACVAGSKWKICNFLKALDVCYIGPGLIGKGGLIFFPI